MDSALTNRVLVLNKNWMAINVTTVFDAVCKAFQGSAVFVDPETYATYDFEQWVDNWEDAIAHANLSEDLVLNCVRYGLKVPEVIICKDYGGTGFVSGPRKPKFSRRNVMARDKNTCQYCDRKFQRDDLNLDHVIPKSRGGEMSWTNIVTACIPCNDKKRDRTPREAGMRLAREPYVPNSDQVRRPFGERLRRKLGKEVPTSWEKFLGKMLSEMYWNVELQD